MTQVEKRPETTHIATEVPSPHIWLAVGLFILGLGAALVAILGPLVTGSIGYHVSEGAANQVLGGDIAGLLLVAPMSFVAGVLVWRGHQAGPILALGPALYAIYMYCQLALGGDVFRYEGNSELYFPVFLGLFVVAGAISIRSWTLFDPDTLPETRAGLDRTVGIFLLVVAFFLTIGLHLPGLADAWSGSPTASDYLADPMVFWLVKFMDLGLVVPALVVGGIGVLRRRPWAGKFECALVGWSALLGASVAGMAIVMQSGSDQSASILNTVVFSVFALIALGLAGAVYRPLFDEQPRRLQ